MTSWLPVEVQNWRRARILHVTHPTAITSHDHSGRTNVTEVEVCLIGL